MNQVSKQISTFKIVPVIKLNRASDAVPLAHALIQGGLPVAEITFRTDAAEQSIANIAKSCPEVLLGAGTVTNVEQVKRAQAAGAKFMVTPGFSRAVTEYCVEHKLPVFPGVCTPSELMWLLEYGLDIAKFFPAEQYGGLNTVKALSAPFPNMKFMPTGGISANNILDYMAFPQIIACGGSWMVKEELMKDGQFDQIAQLVSEAVALVQGKN